MQSAQIKTVGKPVDERPEPSFISRYSIFATLFVAGCVVVIFRFSSW